MTDWLTNSPRIRLRKSSLLRDATGLQMTATLGPRSSWVWIASQLGVTRRRRTRATARSHAQPGRAAINTPTSMPARTQPRPDPSRIPDLNDPQILLLELAHGMLVDTETYIDCPCRYWRVAQVPGRRSAYGNSHGAWGCYRRPTPSPARPEAEGTRDLRSGAGHQ